MMDDRDDDRIAGYLRRRGEVRVPEDLIERTTARSFGARGQRALDRPARWLSLAALTTVVIVAGLLVVGMPPNLPVASNTASNAAVVPSASPGLNASPSQSPPETQTSPAVGAPFPSSVLGMPVVTISEAIRLHDTGALDGQDVAIGGYFTQGFPSCPAPNGYTGPLDDWCRLASFADTKEGARNCTAFGSSGVSCTGGVEPGPMVPLFLSDTLATDAVQSTGIDPIPIVVIAHAADPRWWQCLSDKAADCKSKLVADRVPWANGVDVSATPNAFDSTIYRQLTPKMTLSDLSKVVGNGQQIVSAAATTADGVRTFDPRWNLVGASVMWVVRTVASAPSGGSDPTRAVTVWLIDDASGEVRDSHALALPSDYKPARLWVTATRQRINSNDEQNTYAYYRVAATDGSVVEDSRIGNGGYGTANSITNGPDLPLLLDPGQYTLTAWLGPLSPGPSDEPIGECATDHTFQPGDDVLLQAVFDTHAPCNWSGAEQPSFGFR